MSVRDHHNPFLRERRKLDRERRHNARKNKRERIGGETRAKLARDLRTQMEDCDNG